MQRRLFIRKKDKRHSMADVYLRLGLQNARIDGRYKFYKIGKRERNVGAEGYYGHHGLLYGDRCV